MQNYDPQQDVIPAAPEPQRPVPGTAKAFSIVAFVCGICSLVTLFVGIQFGIAGLVFASPSATRTKVCRPSAATLTVAATPFPA